MSQSTLSLKMSDLEGAIGLFLGRGRGTANGDSAWSTQDQSIITGLRNSGERTFYHPAIEGVIYVWSFLRPVATLTLPQAASVFPQANLAGAAISSILPMPDDFGGIEGELTVSSPTSALWESVPLIADVRPYYARNPTLTGRPRMANVEPIRGTTPSAGQRHQLCVWPAADQAYTLQFAYYINPNAMNGTLPYALGGPQHAETLQAACVAAAELYLDDMRGPRWEYFQERLLASVNMDRKLKPQLLGYNRDRSDMRETSHYGHVRGWWSQWADITFNGVGYP